MEMAAHIHNVASYHSSDDNLLTSHEIVFGVTPSIVVAKTWCDWYSIKPGLTPLAYNS